MSEKKSDIPVLPCLDEYAFSLASVVGKTSYLPNPQTVDAMGGAVFPTIRDFDKRVLPIMDSETIVGMFDDNTTPRWAFLWVHGIPQTNHPKGWTFAHVWPSRDDQEAYTHLANLAMLPKAFGTLTDKRVVAP